VKIYVVQDGAGSTLGAEFSLEAAKRLGREDKGRAFSVTRITIDNTRDAVRRLLGNMGGFATESEIVYTRGGPV
jgi:hypothetical protein